MQRLTKKMLVAAATAFVASGPALANDDGKDCSLATLRGHYVFSATGYNIVAGIPQPKAIIEKIDFNGDGTLFVPAATRSVNGVVARSLPGGGTYTLDAGCTGTLTFTDGPGFDIFVAPLGEEYYMIQTTPNTVFQGTVVRLSR